LEGEFPEKKLIKIMKNGNVVFVEFNDRVDLIESAHKSNGHLGGNALGEWFQRRYWWPNMKNFIKKVLINCKECQLQEGSGSIQEELHPLPVVGPFHRWHIDFIGRLPKTLNENCYILVAVDAGTKWPVLRATKDNTEDTVALFIYEEIFLNYGCPVELVSDRAKEFQGKVVKRFLEYMKTNHHLTSSYHPRSNGAVERLNGVIGNMITKLAKGAAYRWDTFLAQVLFVCRTRHHFAIGYSPFYMLYGVEPNLPGDELFPYLMLPSSPEDELEYRAQRFEEIGMIREAAQLRLSDQANKMTKQYQKSLSRQVVELKPGYFVLFKKHKRILKLGNEKFQFKWLGPFVIRRVGPFGTFQLMSPKGKVKRVYVHRDDLKLVNIPSVAEALEQWNINPQDEDEIGYDETIEISTIVWREDFMDLILANQVVGGPCEFRG
jgi:hypothetical protein